MGGERNSVVWIFNARVLTNALFLAAVFIWAKLDNDRHGYNPLSISSSMAIVIAYAVGYISGTRKPVGSRTQALLSWYSVPLFTLVSLLGGAMLEFYRGQLTVSNVLFHGAAGLIVSLILAVQASIAAKMNPETRTLAQRLKEG